jgi:hypothetical protein
MDLNHITLRSSAKSFGCGPVVLLLIILVILTILLFR